MKHSLLTISRYALAAWVGAAVLFVLTSVAEVRSPELDSATKSTLALLRFPYYYAVGFTLVPVAMICEVLGCSIRYSRHQRLIISLVCLTLLLMLIDYFLIYQPLAEMTRQNSRPPNFIAYHHYSRWINTLHVSIATITSLVASRTESHIKADAAHTL